MKYTYFDRNHYFFPKLNWIVLLPKTDQTATISGYLYRLFYTTYVCELTWHNIFNLGHKQQFEHSQRKHTTLTLHIFTWSWEILLDTLFFLHPHDFCLFPSHSWLISVVGKGWTCHRPTAVGLLNNDGRFGSRVSTWKIQKLRWIRVHESWVWLGALQMY